MTRFARAKGSRASNEKTPGDSTPWDLMKEQLLVAQKKDKEAKFKEEAEKKRLENYENFLKEQKVQKRKSVWSEFEEAGTKKVQNNKDLQDGKVIGKAKKKKYNAVEKTIENVISFETENSVVKKSEINLKKVNENQLQEQSVEKKKKKKHKNKANKTLIDNGKANAETIISESEFKGKETKQTYQENEDKSEVIKEKNIEKRKKKKNKHKNKVNQNDGHKTLTDNANTKAEIINSMKDKEQNYIKNEFTSEVVEDKDIIKNKKNKNKAKTVQDDTNSNLYNNFDSQNENNMKVTKSKSLNRMKNKKLVDGQPVRRKALSDRSFQLIINGKEVQLLRFDGFPVMKKDAERLEELKKNMIKKGIPKSEVQRTMKLERRRAEKTLARLKREVCYNCRKGGHNLSDCPELKSKIPGKDSAEGICFKCGSTEHRQFECKVQKDKEFRFATCFICKEPGHIARQCPDNPRGLYPNGGSCKLCNDVTHLRKDCPTIQVQKGESSVKLLTLDATENIEDIGEKLKSNSVHESKKPKKIKF